LSLRNVLYSTLPKYVYPLLYHLLKRHFDIMRLACVHILDSDEFTGMSGSLAIIFQAVDERTTTLEGMGLLPKIGAIL
jgi:hypothetical protein